MRYPLRLLVYSVIGLTVAAWAAVNFRLHPNSSDPSWAILGFGAIAAGPLLFIGIYFLGRYRLSDDGMAYRNFLGFPRYMRWADLREVRYKWPAYWFRLRSRSGATACVSLMLTDQPDFARHLLRYAPDEAFDQQARLILNRIAQGEVPSQLL